MIRVNAIISDVVPNIITPIAKQVINKIILDLDVARYFDNRVYFNSDSSGGSRSFGADHNPILKENRFTANIGYSLNPLTPKWATTKFTNMISGTDSLGAVQEPRTVFYDHRALTTLVEHESPCNVLAECKMTFVDRTVANEVLTKLYTLYDDGEMYTSMDYRFEYPIPKEIVNFLFGIKKMIDPDMDFLEYLRTFSANVIDLQVNKHDNTVRQLVAKRSTAKCVNMIEFGQERPEAQMTASSADLYTITFNITTQFSRPHMSMLIYPYCINNTLVPDNLLNVKLDVHEKTSAEGFTHFSENAYLLTHPIHGKLSHMVSVPWYDTWMPRSSSAVPSMGFTPFLAHHFTLDDVDNPTGVTNIDLTALAYPLKQTTLDEILALGNEAFTFSNRFNIAVYINDLIVEPANLSINGSVITVPNRNTYAVYRLVLSENKDKTNGLNASFRVLNCDIIAQR